MIFFHGTFDGNGKKIKNIYINRVSEDYVGLFGKSLNSKIYKISVTGNILGNEYVGGIVGRGHNIEQCQNSAYIYGTENYVGGIAGYLDSIIKYCINEGNIEIEEGADIGGIVGSAPSEVSYSYNKGKVIDKLGFGNTGGIAGISGPDKIIANCYNAGELVESLGDSGTFTGGIIGQHRGTILNCYNLSDVKDVEGSAGIANRQGSSVPATIKNSYNTGNADNGIWYVMSKNLVEISQCYYLKGTAEGRN